MKRRWFIRVGTKTTPRNQSVIKAAKEDRLQQRHLDYVMLKYSNALFYPLFPFDPVSCIGGDPKLPILQKATIS
ncbi:MAG: hypothetical protein AAB019_11085 [Planctomycetota bacterium]